MHIGILSQPSNFHCQKWARALQKAGNQVTVISLDAYKIADIECINLNPNSASWKYQDFYFSRNRLKEVLKSIQIDILHPLHLTPYGVWGLWSGFQPMIPAAIGADVFEYLPQNAIPQLDYRSWKNLTQTQNIFYQFKYVLTKWYHKTMVQKVLQSALYVTADNQTLMDALKHYFQVPEHKLVLQRWGVDEELFEAIPTHEYSKILTLYHLNPEQPIILSPRGLMPIYQADIILDSFYSLVPQFNHFQFVMLSAGYPISIQIEKKIQNLEEKFSNFHCIRTQIPREHMAVLWKKTCLFISAPIYDGYSATVAEGRYVGAIPVVNNIPGNREVIEHLKNGIIVDPFNTQNLTDTLVEIITNLEYYYLKFKPINQEWIKKNGLLMHDAQKFSNFLKNVINL